MKVRLLARAERDVATAADFYESARPGLGGQFFADLDATLMHMICYDMGRMLRPIE